jgi:trehalose monomycolate/heme transporter
LRAESPPAGARAYVFGQAPTLYDSVGGLKARAPWMLAVVGAAMFVVLFFAFRSMVLPVKAMVMTTLSLTASFGAIVYVFQDGRLQSLLHYHSLGTIDATLPVVLFAVVFGLSMDYEVLILGRIREAYLRTGDNRAAIVDGVTRTARLVTGAALLMISVFAACAAAPVVFVKAVGLGMAMAVALDATVVRMLLVPATMALLGRLNWWVPRRLRR